ncbi:hypothetical protein G6M89_02225 [Natronolimnobius sp. AArcel1]|uniref:hypothetical protein n=1 Tax=Natronolimnobius sp. AArcel1 TaxID=1679093 RepID=UPI0013EAAF38|nr:hypothetical protein [Natronolimnobius sp. AArcel1]NGM67837.1 hypothetical protein [Natronolimnobius sp. AArcel1]
MAVAVWYDYWKNVQTTFGVASVNAAQAVRTGQDDGRECELEAGKRPCKTDTYHRSYA